MLNTTQQPKTVEEDDEDVTMKDVKVFEEEKDETMPDVSIFPTTASQRARFRVDPVEEAKQLAEISQMPFGFEEGEEDEGAVSLSSFALQHLDNQKHTQKGTT